MHYVMKIDVCLFFYVMQKDVSQMQETIAEEEGLFRPNISRRILAEEGTVSDMTHRSLKRANIILEAIKNHQVIEEIGILLRVRICVHIQSV